MQHPMIIQGGMGVAVSDWRLARAVSMRGQLGVVSGTALDAVLARRLQLGDVGGHLARAFAQFPVPEIAERIWNRYFVPGGKAPSAKFKSKPLPNVEPARALSELTVLANFVEVFLAREGHDGYVGINLLEKVQLQTLPSLYGAMLAGVNYVLMGAGIPRAIPGVLNAFGSGSLASIKIDVTGQAGDESTLSTFDPSKILGTAPKLPRPTFLAIVSSVSLAQVLARKCDPPVDGFVIEHHIAGGHNAPPRGALQLSEEGEPIYGERDLPDFEKFRELGLPFWLAGGRGTHEGLAEALELGAQGIQVGTAFAFCEESGILPEIKAAAIRKSIEGGTSVFTDPSASPTGFPFKVLDIPGSVSDAEVRESRERICDLGYLRECYIDEKGKVAYRCPAEPVEDYVRKGGDQVNTKNRACVCNGLMATIGLAQVRKDKTVEPPLVTAGDDALHISRYLKPGKSTYTAADVLDVLLN
jgi:nitronate monooxygenase